MDIGTNSGTLPDRGTAKTRTVRASEVPGGDRVNGFGYAVVSRPSAW